MVYNNDSGLALDGSCAEMLSFFICEAENDRPLSQMMDLRKSRRNDMNLTSYLVECMGNTLIKVEKGTSSLPSDAILQFPDGQSEVPMGTILLMEQSEAFILIPQYYFVAGSCLLLSACNSAYERKTLNIPNTVTVIQSSLPSASLCNLVNRGIQEYRRRGAEVLVDETEPTSRLIRFWQKLANGQIFGHDVIYQALQDIIPECNRYYRILIFNSDADLGDIQLLQACLRKHMPNMYLFRPDIGFPRELLALQFLSDQIYCTVQDYEAVDCLLKEWGLDLMVSNATKDYSRMYMLYQLTRQTHKLSMAIQDDKISRIRFFEKYTMYTVMDLCAQRYSQLYGNMDIIYLAHPIVIHLMRYDQKHGTNLREVLFQYLVNDRDLKCTAQTLYMHRNTVMNKLNMIRSICSVDFEDGEMNQRLLFSCQLVNYYEQVLKQNLRV